MRYIAHRMRRLRATPYAIAVGCAAGVFAAFTPFLGLHFILAGLIAWIARGSIIAAALGTFFGNPLTFPLIWFGSYKLGAWMLGMKGNIKNIDLSGGIFDKSEQIWPLLKPMTVGGIPLGIVAAAIAYFIAKKASEAYREKRRLRQQRGVGPQQPAQA
ncbi:MAG: DUF2062 domain-containing protein [Hyphomicrobiaceae bacterium]|nr:DUF2062 domain-containing protein [Hyphomicrobiaceae bacterium]